jgi:2,4-dienoyl-CoA reductase-like NADH-dependent reductase (Old Yellow Enzyme family)/thioredoxin reductase
VATYYAHVFSPLRIGPIEVGNRVYLPPHGIPLVVPGPHGTSVPSDDFACYYAERAAAGVALFGHSLSVLPSGLACPVYEEAVPSFAGVADAVHAHGARIFGQLHYSSLTAGPWEPLSPRAPVLGASSYQRYERYDTHHVLSRHEIRQLVAMYRRCAEHLRLAGYDGVEVHAAHGVLVEQFLSPYFNSRHDEYGGDVRGRMRLLVETLGAVREGGGDGVAVGVRLVCDEHLPGGLGRSDVQEIVLELVDRGLIDFADMDTAVEPQQPHLMTAPSLVAPMGLAEDVAAIREIVTPRVAVISALGRVTDLADAERVIADGTVDMVGVARGLIAEPELVRNAREGRAERSRTCIACNHCIATVQRPGGGYGCAINPASGRERRWGVHSFTPAARQGTVVVVGGGPAGMEAARVAALRGHRVTLLERRAALGGQLALWAALPGRENYRGVIDWYERRFAELGVTVHKGVTADPAGIRRMAPDAVVLAVGARYVRTGESGFAPTMVLGWDSGFVHTPEEVLAGHVQLTGNVVVLDEEGINTGVGVAEVLAARGARVRLVTRHPELVCNLAFDGHGPLIAQRLVRLGVEVSTRTYVRCVDDHRVTLYDVMTGEETTLSDVDAVVFATMRRPEADLAEDLDVAQTFVIGDALAPRGLAEATYEGQRFARLVGEHGAPSTTGESLLRQVPADAFPHAAATLAVPS